jgi:hypothetical protein
MLMRTGEELHEPSVKKLLANGVERGFAGLQDRADIKMGTRAWSKPRDRIGEAGHEESKPAK